MQVHMSGRIKRHIRSNVVGYVAVFFALSGTAVALPNHNTVFSDDIKNGEVKTPDVGANAITSPKIASKAVGPRELAPDAVNSPRIIDQGVRSADVRDDTLAGGGLGALDLAADSVGSSEIANNAVSGAEITDGYSSSASATGGGCNDDDSNGEVCATTNITLSETAKLLVNATGGWHTHGTSGAMSCKLDHDGIETIGTPQSIGEVGADHPLGGGDGTMALTGISADIGPGTHAISLICTQTDPDLDLTNSNLTVATVDE